VVWSASSRVFDAALYCSVGLAERGVSSFMKGEAVRVGRCIQTSLFMYTYLHAYMPAKTDLSPLRFGVFGHLTDSRPHIRYVKYTVR